MAESSGSRIGKVYLVGAGPGDPGLLTLRGAECLARGEVVFYDYLVNPALLDHAAAGARLVRLGHHSQGRTLEQEEINHLVIAAAREGRTVVRLKGGDPDVFARTAEEVGALAAAGIPYETVPGVTAGLAAGGYAEIPLTHADHSSCVALVTGQERRDKDGPALDYSALAQFPGTLVFYMGIRSAKQWSQALIDAGRSPETPVAIVQRATCPNQDVDRCTLGTVTDTIRSRHIRPPAITVVGHVAHLGPAVSWFAARPLFGQTVLVTRPRHQAAALCNRLTELGAHVLVQPMIEIAPPDDWRSVDEALARLNTYDWLVFSSANGVRYLLDRLMAGGGDMRRLAGVRLAAIGPGTAESLAEWKLHADLVPTEYRAEALAEALATEAPGKRILLARASRGREVLAERLMAAGATVDQVVVYASRDVEQLEENVQAAVDEGTIDWISVTSSAIGRSAVRLLGPALGEAKAASISPITSQVLRGLGCEPVAEAAQYTIEGLVEALLNAENREK